MKHFTKLLIIFTFVTALVTIPSIDYSYAYAEDSSIDMDNLNWIDENGNYHFPITQYDEEWQHLSCTDEMRQVTQIPDSILKSISTPELIDLIIEYPLLCDIKAYESIYEGYQHVKENFNGIQELLSRSNAYYNLIQKYKTLNIPEKRIFPIDEILSASNSPEHTLNSLISNHETRTKIYEDASVQNSINILEFMLYDILQDNAYNSAKFVREYIAKTKEKIQSEYYEVSNSQILLSTALSQNSTLFTVNDINAINTLSASRISGVETTTTIYTPSGTRVTVIYYTQLEMCKYSDYADLIAEYGAESISIASKTFNCHSFAWLRDRQSNYQHIWLGSSTDNTALSAFQDDPKYRKSTTAKVGDIASWSQHSAIITQTNVKHPDYDVPDSLCISKWGSGPIVKHYLTKCPYYHKDSTNVTYYKLYK